MPTAQELQKKREKADRLREQIADAELAASTNAANATNEVEGAQLDAELARLETRLARAKQAAKVSVVNEGTAGPLAAAKEQLEAAQAAKDAPVGPVDTNAGTTDKNDKE